MNSDKAINRVVLPKWFNWFFALACFYLIYRVHEVLVPFLISFVIAYFLDPFVANLEKKGIKRVSAIWRVYLLMFLVVVLFIIVVIPPVIRQARQMETGIEKYLSGVRSDGVKFYDKNGSSDKIYMPYNINVSDSAKNSFTRELSLLWLGLINRYPFLKEHFGDEKTIIRILEEKQQEIAGFTLKALSEASTRILSSLSHIITIILLPLLTFYFLCVIDPLKKRILHLISDPDYKREIVDISSEINVMLGKYIKGQLLICVLVGLSNSIAAYIISLFFHTKYSLLLGFITGVTCIIPYFGAIISALTGILIGLFTSTTSPILAAVVILIAMMTINQTFDNFISPRIVGEQVGLHPLWTLFALLAGGKIFGVVGMLIAVPIAATLKICIIRIFPKLEEPISCENKNAKDLQFVKSDVSERIDDVSGVKQDKNGSVEEVMNGKKMVESLKQEPEVKMENEKIQDK